MIGISLPLSHFAAIADRLSVLFDLGVRQIELQYVEKKIEKLLPAIRLLRASGFELMLHVGMSLNNDLIRTLISASEIAGQESIPLILSDTAIDSDEIHALLTTVQEQMLPLVPTVEYHGNADAEADAGLCLNVENIDENIIADKNLKNRLVCVRLKDTDMPIDSTTRDQLSRLSYGYLGSYNVSLSLGGKSDKQRITESVIDAVHRLHEALPLCARLYDDIGLNFDERLKRALTVWDRPQQGTYFSLIHSTAFLFQTNGFRWAMDVAFRNAYRLAALPHEAATLLSNLELMIISHEHADHFEERTVRQLSQNDTQWIIPDFLTEIALKWGIRQDRIIPAHAGEPICVGPLTVYPFEGRHFRPVSGKGVRSLGYYVTAGNSPSLVFPGDTRDFSTVGLPQIPEADWCFANVWLGDKSGFADDYGDLLTDYSKFMLRFSHKNILFAHLYECNRKAEDMWRREHAFMIADVMSKIVPETRLYIPGSGDVMHLE